MPNKFATAAKGPQEAQPIIKMVYMGSIMVLRKPRSLSSAVGIARLRFRIQEARVKLYLVVNRRDFVNRWDLVEVGDQAAWDLVGCSIVFIPGESTQAGGTHPDHADQAFRRLLAATRVLHNLQRSFIRSGAPSPAGSGTDAAANTSLAVAGPAPTVGGKVNIAVQANEEPPARFTVQLVHLNGMSTYYRVRASLPVARFMQAIELYEGLRAGQYRLVHDGRRLAAGTMASDGVREASRIDVILPYRFVGPAEEAARMAEALSRLANGSRWKLYSRSESLEHAAVHPNPRI